MERIKISPRKNWKQRVEKIGFNYHTDEIPYWNESAYYKLNSKEIDEIKSATTELWAMCLEAVDFVISNRLYHKFNIPDFFVPHIERTWKEASPTIYGRFDLCYKEGMVKLLEFQADSPLSLFESAIVQRRWLNDFDNSKEQFNSIDTELKAAWGSVSLNAGTLYFSCSKDKENYTTTDYIRQCATHAGVSTEYLNLTDIGWDAKSKQFVDLKGNSIKNIFKLYPYEWIINDQFGKELLNDVNKAIWIEPSWKLLLSNKAILPVLWQLFPEHPNLLSCYYNKGGMTNYARKPCLSMSGYNITLVSNGEVIEQGESGKSEGFIYQELFTLPDFDGNHPLICSWIIGQKPAGIGIRESSNLITDKKSRFVPHLIG